MSQPDDPQKPASSDDPKTCLVDALTYPGLAPRQDAETVITLVCRPSHDPAANWTLLQHENDWFVRRITRSFGDGPLAHKVPPKTYGAEARVPEKEAARILAAFEELSVVPLADQGKDLFIDGCEYEIQWGGIAAPPKISWWNEAPPEWRALRDWYSDAVALFEAYLSKPTVPIKLVHLLTE